MSIITYFTDLILEILAMAWVFVEIALMTLLLPFQWVINWLSESIARRQLEIEEKKKKRHGSQEVQKYDETGRPED